MKIVKYDDYESLAASMIFLTCECDLDVTSVLFFDDAAKLTQELLRFDGVDIGYIELSNPIYGDDREYYVCVDPELTLYVEPAWNDKLDKYISADSDVLLLGDEVSSKIELPNDGSTMFELRIGEDEEFDDDIYGCQIPDYLCDDDCENCPFNDDDEVEDDDDGEMSDEEYEKILDEVIETMRKLREEINNIRLA